MIANPPGRLTEDRTYPALRICIYYVLSYISFSVIPLSHRYAGYCLEAGDNISPEHKEVRTFFDGGLQIRRNA